MKKLGCAKCGGTKKMKLGGSAVAKAPVNMYGIPQENMGTSSQMGFGKKGGTVKVTTSRPVKTSCKNTKVRSASGACVSERPAMKKGGSTKSFPDLNKDGKVTKADILIGKKVIPKAQKGAIVDSTKATSFQVHKKKQMPSFAAPSKEVKTLDSNWNPKNTYTKESEYKNPISKKKVGGATHPGFKAVQSKIAAKQGISKEAAGAILASSTRKASAKAKAANPRLKRVK